MMNYYNLLGIAPDATKEIIESAYRRRCRPFHVDSALKNGIKLTPDEIEKYTKILVALHEAKTALLDPKLREMHDAHLKETSQAFYLRVTFFLFLLIAPPIIVFYYIVKFGEKCFNFFTSFNADANAHNPPYLHNSPTRPTLDAPTLSTETKMQLNSTQEIKQALLRVGMVTVQTDTQRVESNQLNTPQSIQPVNSPTANDGNFSTPRVQPTLTYRRR